MNKNIKKVASNATLKEAVQGRSNLLPPHIRS